MKRILIAGVFLLVSTMMSHAQNCEAIKARMYAISRHAGWGDLATLKNLEQQYYRCLQGRSQQQRHPRCKKGQVARGKYCMPKGSSQCPKQRSKHCAAPSICATNLSGEDSCFTKEGMQELRTAKKQRTKEIRAAKAKRMLEKRIASRKARESPLRRSFKKRHGLDYAQWLDKIRQLVAILLKIPAGETEQIKKAKTNLQTTFTPPSTTALPPPVGSGFERLKTGKISKRCERNFDLSELWDEGFKMDRCTSRGWVIARRNIGGRALAECVALHPSGSLQIALKQRELLEDMKQSPNFDAELTITNLKADSWLLGQDDTAATHILVDGTVLHEQPEKVSVSDNPPLRYSFSRDAKSSDLESLATGSSAVAQIADKKWIVNLRGSANAIKDVKYCAYQNRMSRAKLAKRE